MNGLFVIYLDVGNLPPDRVNAHVNQQKETISDLIVKLKADGYEILVLPIRPNSETRVEMISLKDPPTYGLGQISLEE